MFGLGMPEILLILAIALIVIGPKKLPELAKTLGKAMGEFKRSAQDFKRSIDIETTVKDIEPPASAPDLKEVLKEANSDKETTENAEPSADAPDQKTEAKPAKDSEPKDSAPKE